VLLRRLGLKLGVSKHAVIDYLCVGNGLCGSLARQSELRTSLRLEGLTPTMAQVAGA
jgi:hypothetical protein